MAATEIKIILDIKASAIPTQAEVVMFNKVLEQFKQIGIDMNILHLMRFMDGPNMMQFGEAPVIVVPRPSFDPKKTH
jgi:hypothetical protein